MPAEISQLRAEFFDYLYGNEVGYICIATQKPHDKASFRQHFFSWPIQRREMLALISTAAAHNNVWFCVNLLSQATRKKEFCVPHNLVWSDLDACNPELIQPRPQVVIESSPSRFQAIWRLDSTIDPQIAEDWSKRLAYLFVENGADPSGWDLTQLLRVPFTTNFKYQETPEVKLLSAFEVLLPSGIFLALPEVTATDQEAEVDESMPDPLALPDAEAVIYKYAFNLSGTAFKYIYGNRPDEGADWSKLLWRLINIAIEAGMSDEETFSVAMSSQVNKYARDKRPLRYLWRDIVKASNAQSNYRAIAKDSKPLSFPIIIESDLELPKTFIDEYRDWAGQATDAVEQYHDLCAFLLLSAVLAGSLRCPTSSGTLIPNLWGLILGESTLSRKTTATRMINDIIMEVDPDIMVATDGSAEGLLSALSERPNRTSIYYKDEVSGFFDSINRKDYLAGMPEILTQLYDVPPFFQRRLRKETISIANPVFIFYGSGIKERVMALIHEDYVYSGFLPRFLIVSGSNDLSRVRPTGPPTQQGVGKREIIVNKARDMYEQYIRTEQAVIAKQSVTVNVPVEVSLTSDAWKRYGDMEMKLVEAATESSVPGLALPAFDRLSRSCLKMAMLIGAARQTPQEAAITIEEEDVLGAMKYIQEWGRYTIDLLENCGQGAMQRLIGKVLNTILRNPGISRGAVMQRHHLDKREMDLIQGTLEDRGQISAVKEGRGWRLTAT